MLSKAKLIDEIRKITDEAYEKHQGFPETDADAIDRWTNAIVSYLEPLQPTLTPVGVETVREWLKVSLTASIKLKHDKVLEYAFNTAAWACGEAMLPAFKGVAPVLMPDFSIAKNAGLLGASSETVAKMIAETAHAWMLTGIATNTATGITINWT